jgi:AmpD protein
MIKIIQFFLLAYGAYWILHVYPKRHRKVNKSDTQFSTEKAGQQVQQIVSCAYCSVRLPMTDSYVFEDRYFCNLDHFYSIDPNGWLGSAKHVASPNYDERPQGMLVDTVVIHHISLPEGKFGGTAIEAFFTNQLDPNEDPYFQDIAHMEVSAHFLIKREGELIQFVSTLKRAWHAGQSELLGRERVNDFSIGIEMEGTGEVPFTEQQYQTLNRLIQAIQTSHDIQYFVGHSDISPDRKTDPGPFFDWKYVSELVNIPEKKLPFGIQRR